MSAISFYSLQWRHKERNGISNHQSHDCLLKCLFRRRSKKISKSRITCEGNSPVTGEFPAQRASTAENVSVSWRHHAECTYNCIASHRNTVYMYMSVSSWWISNPPTLALSLSSALSHTGTYGHTRTRIHTQIHIEKNRSLACRNIGVFKPFTVIISRLSPSYGDNTEISILEILRNCHSRFDKQKHATNTQSHWGRQDTSSSGWDFFEVQCGAIKTRSFFFQNPHNRHPIARPSDIVIAVPYHDKLDRVKTAHDCSRSFGYLGLVQTWFSTKNRYFVLLLADVIGRCAGNKCC